MVLSGRIERSLYLELVRALRRRRTRDHTVREGEPGWKRAAGQDRPGERADLRPFRGDRFVTSIA